MNLVVSTLFLFFGQELEELERKKKWRDKVSLVRYEAVDTVNARNSRYTTLTHPVLSISMTSYITMYMRHLHIAWGGQEPRKTGNKRISPEIFYKLEEYLHMGCPYLDTAMAPYHVPM